MKKLSLFIFLVIFGIGCKKHKIQNKCCSESHILEKQDSSYIGIPNIFTPNGDGENDALCANQKNIKEITITITETGGILNSKVFQSSDPEFCWDGRYKNKIAKDGKYNIKVVGTSIAGNSFSKEGSVWLIRNTSKYCIDHLNICAFLNQFDTTQVVFDLTKPNGESLETCK